jgi:hypothetical protein
MRLTAFNSTLELFAVITDDNRLKVWDTVRLAACAGLC